MSRFETSHWGRSAVLALFCLTSGCGGATASPEHAGDGHHRENGADHGDHGGHHGDHEGEHGGGHHKLDGSLAAFHDVLAPAWHSEPGKTRVTAACAKAADMRPLAATLETSPPAAASADADGWKTDAKTLQTDVEALVAACASAGQADVEPTLAKVHDGFHRLMERGMKH